MVSAFRERETRQDNNLHVPRRRTTLADKAMSVRGAKVWNTLPSNIKEVHGYVNFKRKLKCHISENHGSL